MTLASNTNRSVASGPAEKLEVHPMERFCEFFTKAKVAVVEIASLIGFVGVVMFGVYFEVHTLLGLLHK